MQDLVQPYLEAFAKQAWRGKPRRPHRVTRLEKQLALTCRTTIPGAKGTMVPFGNVAVADLTTPDIEAWRESHQAHMQRMERERVERAERLAAGDAKARDLRVSPERPRSQSGHVGLNRHLDVIRQWLNWAIKKGHRDAENPFYRHGVEVVEFTDEHDRTRRLLAGEEERLLAAAKKLGDRWSQLRPATEADREFCFRLNEACFRKRIEQIRGWDEMAERADCASQFRLGSDSIVLVQGRRAGHVAIEEYDDRVEIRMLLLAPEVQRRGVGSSVLRAVVDRARARQVRATVWVTDWNEGAIRLYRRFGFEVVDKVWRPEKRVRKLRMVTRSQRE